MENKTELEKWFEILDVSYKEVDIKHIISQIAKFKEQGYNANTLILSPKVYNDLLKQDNALFQLNYPNAHIANVKLFGLDVFTSTKLSDNEILIK